MITDVIGEDECRRIIALWMLDNKKNAVLPVGMSREEYAETFPFPELDYTYTRTQSVGQGQFASLMKGEIVLKDWETKNGRHAAKLTVYKVMIDDADLPEYSSAGGYIVCY